MPGHKVARLFVGLTAAMAVLGMAVTAEAQEKKIKIGVIYDLTGPLAGGGSTRFELLPGPCGGRTVKAIRRERRVQGVAEPRPAGVRPVTRARRARGGPRRCHEGGQGARRHVLVVRQRRAGHSFRERVGERQIL